MDYIRLCIWCFFSYAFCWPRWCTAEVLSIYPILVQRNHGFKCLITVFAIIGSCAQFIFLFNFFHSVFRGQKSVQNPWKSNTLEWTTPVEHIHGNWPGKIPEVYRWPYDYSKPCAETDFIPQNVPPMDGEENL